jgi:hypothetical protein
MSLLDGHVFAPPRLHVTDDAIPHREPGTTDADHVTGAGLTTAVLAVAAIGAPRLRAASFTAPPAVVARRAGSQRAGTLRPVHG